MYPSIPLTYNILHLQLRDLEAEFEAEQRRGRDLTATNRKLERCLMELRVTADDDRRLVVELQDQVTTLSQKVKTLRRQLEEAVSCSDHGIAMMMV